MCHINGQTNKKREPAEKAARLETAKGMKEARKAWKEIINQPSFIGRFPLLVEGLRKGTL